MYEIIPGVFLSNYNDAIKNNLYRPFIVNCTKDLPMISSFGIRIPVDDDLSERSMHIMAAAFPSTIDSIDQVRKNGGSVLVHCAAGQQRSAAVVAAYLVSKGIDLDRAIAYIKSKKPDAFYRGVNFESALRSFVSRRYI